MEHDKTWNWKCGIIYALVGVGVGARIVVGIGVGPGIVVGVGDRAGNVVGVEAKFGGTAGAISGVGYRSEEGEIA